LRQGLEQAGRHYLRAGDYPKARAVFEEAVAQFGTRAATAADGLETLKRLGR